MNPLSFWAYYPKPVTGEVSFEEVLAWLVSFASVHAIGEDMHREPAFIDAAIWLQMTLWSTVPHASQRN